MFGKDRKGGGANGYTSATTLVARGTEITGDVGFSGNLEVEGRIVGEIRVGEGAQASVRVLEHGEVEGDVRVPNIIINGRVKGDVYASGRIELAAKARVDGNVHYNVIEMTKGAQVNGSLVFTPEEGEVAAPATTVARTASDDDGDAAAETLKTSHVGAISSV